MATSPNRGGGLKPRLRRLAIWTALVDASLLVALAGARALTVEPAPAMHVLWRDGISEARRRQLEW